MLREAVTLFWYSAETVEWVEKICLGETFFCFDRCMNNVTDCVMQIAGREWSTSLGVQTNAPCESGAWQAWRTQSVRHSRLTGFGTSVVSQRWLTVWQGDKTCTAQDMFRQAWKRCVLFLSHTVTSSFFLFHSKMHNHGAKEILHIFHHCACMYNVKIQWNDHKF